MIQNNEETIAQTLESILPLQANIMVFDAGCQDKTVNICKSYGISVKKTSAIPDRSKARNEHIKNSLTSWQFYIEPWEILLSGHDELAELIKTDNKSYHCDLLQGDIITKQIRLWRKDTLYFTNPIFETLKDDNSEYAANVIICLTKNEMPNQEKIEKWKQSNPFAIDPYYFQSYALLSHKKYKEFLTCAEHYLFKERQNTIPTIMMRYYIGIVHCLVTNDIETAIRNALICIGSHPLMAEFWCLLGDVYFQAKNFEKSVVFYDTAMVLGQRRLRSDRWPMHISKYEEYPKEMIESCKKIMRNEQKFYVEK